MTGKIAKVAKIATDLLQEFTHDFDITGKMYGNYHSSILQAL